MTAATMMIALPTQGASLVRAKASKRARNPASLLSTARPFHTDRPSPISTTTRALNDASPCLVGSTSASKADGRLG